MRYSVCIATFRRPDGLSALLQSLDGQILDDGDELEIIVVDNDPPSAEPVIDAFRATSKHTVIGATQPVPNISLTRNAAVEIATGEWLWFVDDDERAEPDCLQQLISVAARTNADVAFGHVLPDFESSVPDWMAVAPMFKRATPTDGADSLADRTGNTLVRRSILTDVPGPFDEALGTSGGEDSDLFHRLRLAGYRLVETDRAVVSETVPADRADWQWMSQRSQRLGRLYADRVIRTADGQVTSPDVLMMLGKAALQVAAYGAATVVSWPNLAKRRHNQQKLYLNTGKLSTLTNRETKSPWA